MKRRFAILCILLSFSPWLKAIEKPYSVLFGRGSGLAGLDVVSFDSSGSARILRENQVCTFQASPEAIISLSKAIDDLHLLTLVKRYSGSMSDGAQWILIIKTATESHTTYFDNQFPDSVRQFSKIVDEAFPESFLLKQKWTRITTKESEAIQNPLWDAIKDN